MDIQELEKMTGRAVLYLADTDSSHAAAKALQTRLHEHRKTVIAMGFEGSSKGAQEARKQDAHNTPELAKHLELMEQADIEFHTLHNRRQTAMAIIELYRTVSANQRKGT